MIYAAFDAIFADAPDDNIVVQMLWLVLNIRVRDTHALRFRNANAVVVAKWVTKNAISWINTILISLFGVRHRREKNDLAWIFEIILTHQHADKQSVVERRLIQPISSQLRKLV